MQLDIKLNLITSTALISIGAALGIYADSHISDLQSHNVELMKINYDLVKENDALRYCVPRKNGKAVVTYVNDRLFCEVHSKV